MALFHVDDSTSGNEAKPQQMEALGTPRGLKRLVPGSLFARVMLIVVIPTVLAQLFTIHMFYQRHWSSMSRNMSASLAGEIAIVTEGIKNADLTEFPRIFKDAKDYLNLNIAFQPEGIMPKQDALTAKQYGLLLDALKEHFTYPAVVSTYGVEQNLHISIRLSTPDRHGVISIKTNRKRLASPTTYIFILSMTGTTAALLFVAILFIRNQVRSIERLALAAEEFGRSGTIGPYKPQGAAEVRKAGMAFIQMKERIQRLLTRRAEMLAAVSHDLRTPLTRMKLQLELLPKSAELTYLKDDIVDMEKMIDGYLNFARGSVAEETTEMKISDLLKDVVDKYALLGKPVVLKLPLDAQMSLRQNAFKRALANILDNALRYGSQVCISTASDKEGHFLLHIDDNGSGIPAEKRNDVFLPFFRLEESRNQETGGVGLGLSIARDIVNAHGGDITLTDSPLGGLRVTLTLPLPL